MVNDRLLEFQRGLSTGSSEKSLNGLAAQLKNDIFIAEEQRLLESEHESHDLGQFFSEVDAITADLDEMANCLTSMKSIHSKILIEPGVHPQHTEELNRHVDKFKVLSKKNRARLQEIKSSIQTVDASSSSDRIKQNQILNISKRLLGVLSDFNEEQVRYREKCKYTIGKFLQVSGREMPEEDIDMAIETGRIFDYTKGMLLAHHDKQILYEEAKSRHEDILRLESSIQELHEIFQDMAMLVESQGQIVDNIELNVGTAADFANKASVNVRKALAAHRGSRKKKIILLIFCVIFVLVAFSVGSTLFCVYVPICGGR
uniref:t-SNARE coiled-coil homology domain-containing protein n=1 Tax=Steinernema glaseri TaxID=37863 RepID=A0A1I7ZTM5_9BILA